METMFISSIILKIIKLISNQIKMSLLASVLNRLHPVSFARDKRQNKNLNKTHRNTK